MEHIPESPYMPKTSSRWDRGVKRAVVIAMIVGALILVSVSRVVIPSLIVAALLAYIVQPAVNALTRLKLPRGPVTALVYLLAIVILILTPIILVPVLIEQIGTIKIPWADLYAGLLNWLQHVPDLYPNVGILGFDVDLQPWYDRVASSLTQFQIDQMLSGNSLINYISQGLSSATTVLGVATGVASNVVARIFTSVFAFLLTLLYSFYMVKDAPLLRDWVEGLFPAEYQPEMHQLIERIERIWQAFFRGQLLLSLTVGVMTTLAMAVIGMPGAILLGLIAGALEVIPNLGPILSMVPAVIVALLQGSTTLPMGNLSFALLTVAVYAGIQQAENNVLVPRIIGQSVNLHPLVVLVGVIVGASQGGILGAFLAAPVLATMRVVAGYMHAKLLDRDPFPPRTQPGKEQSSPSWITNIQIVWRKVVQRVALFFKPAKPGEPADNAGSTPPQTKP